MITTTPSQIVWQPILLQKGVGVALSPEFAKACVRYALDKDTERKITQNAWENMGRKGPFTPSNFFHFNCTLLLEGIYLKSGAGTWLTVDPGTLSSIVRPVMYHGHNAEHFSEDRLDLIHAFGEWVSSAQALLDWK